MLKRHQQLLFRLIRQSVLHQSSPTSSSASSTLLNSENGEKFVKTVVDRLAQCQAGNATAAPEQISYWESISKQSAKVSDGRSELSQLRTIINDPKETEEMRKLAEVDVESIEENLETELQELAVKIVPLNNLDVLSKCQIELSCGAGGQEAMLFTGELLDMYQKLAAVNSWKWDPLQVDNVPLGGVRSALIAVSGEKVYAKMRFEAGVHRVQRVPVNDSRMHTSTASISVLPEPEEVSVVVPSDSVKIEAMRASGPGGQNVNKRSTAVRMTHKETGIAVHCMDERFQHLNIQIAYKRLAAILMQKQVDAMLEKIVSKRKLQVGSKARAEKIRTYNFQHDRVTDHRIQMSITGVAEFLSAGETLQTMIERLQEQHLEDRLDHIIENCIVE
ncbi:putative peptide chain release factor 1, mitochondrial [Caenorhabditis elegans]|uniref:Probable peptide chain release factor 1, mitochondrial n=2 Tax=Caenorhabditis elegans TaxID=6239 RepID=RF1M_CAEEL|nr:putative peptide chain release factor 1, mitochondrial [Caenorhabditis elegans]O44568.1 RecName: Full=Probable peptide chain release factor 1, mitochondrial; Short=MRF-1; Short=MtRF-1; Flags: Precursor [Caenorhabditis elegans]CCD65509.1 Probable peptide chain release factor 1, mitochondrial [Caenorhabditis elegans]|eukprot:NP_500737.1 Probable peptide chain release factor 1, mitochondrial [Caenorhabditis elegans]